MCKLICIIMKGDIEIKSLQHVSVSPLACENKGESTRLVFFWLSIDSIGDSCWQLMLKHIIHLISSL
jgi:hypothetical protein